MGAYCENSIETVFRRVTTVTDVNLELLSSATTELSTARVVT